MQKQVNKSDWDGSDIIFKRKICIYSARGPSLANVTEKKFLHFLFLVTDRGLVEILNLHREWKNAKTKNIVLFPNWLQRELFFSKCKKFLGLAFLEFRAKKMKKNCKQKFAENGYFTACFD